MSGLDGEEEVEITATLNGKPLRRRVKARQHLADFLRQELELYACVRPIKAYPGARNLRDDLDFVVVRENSEDIYIGIEADA